MMSSRTKIEEPLIFIHMREYCTYEKVISAEGGIGLWDLPVSPGSYYVGMIVDPHGEIEELYEGNNTACAPEKIEILPKEGINLLIVPVNIAGEGGGITPVVPQVENLPGKLGVFK